MADNTNLVDDRDPRGAVIVSVEAFPYRHVLPDGGYGCAKFIATARTGTLVKVTTRDGQAGWGEAIGDPSLVLPAIADQARGLLRHPPAVREGRIMQLVSRRYHLTTGGPHMFAASALDTALWDAFARSLHVPISDLLGGTVRDRVFTYASTGYVTPTNDESRFADEISRALADGFRGVKIRIGASPADDENRVRVARDIFGTEGRLMVDYNTHGTLTSIRRSLPRIRPYELTWVEEPLSPEDRSGWGELRRGEDVLAGGESLCTRFAFRDVIAERRVDVVQPDLAACGGITEGWAIAQHASLYGIDVAPHCWGSGILQLATLQLLAAATSEPVVGGEVDRLTFEWDRGENPFRDGVLTSPVQREDGNALVPQGNGLGVDVDEEWVRAHVDEVFHICI